MSHGKPPASRKSARGKKEIIFLLIVAGLYGLLFGVMPDKGAEAAGSCWSIFRHTLIPLLLVFAILLLINLFLKPSRIAGLLGKDAGIRGLLLSAAAGIISTGPIYAWYPLLGDLKKKGAHDALTAVFLYNRGIKPFLLPVIVGYFGWMYAVLLTACMLLGSFALGYAMNQFNRHADISTYPNNP